MSKITRFAGNLLAFASSALAGERTVFGDTLTTSDSLTDNVTAEYLRGWGIVGPDQEPTLQDFNAMGFVLSQFIAYLHQTGVAEYDALQEYNIGSWTTDGGVLYVSLVNANIGNDPATDTAGSPTGTYWQRFGTAAYEDASYFDTPSARDSAISSALASYLTIAAAAATYFPNASAGALASLSSIGNSYITDLAISKLTGTYTATRANTVDGYTYFSAGFITGIEVSAIAPNLSIQVYNGSTWVDSWITYDYALQNTTKNSYYVCPYSYISDGSNVRIDDSAASGSHTWNWDVIS